MRPIRPSPVRQDGNPIPLTDFRQFAGDRLHDETADGYVFGHEGMMGDGLHGGPDTGFGGPNFMKGH